jgi:hypothetical protein
VADLEILTMPAMLKGNFEPKTAPVVERKEQTLEDRFEQAALARLGGSIGYVSRRSFLWTGDTGDRQMKVEGRAEQYDTDSGKR